MTPRRSKREVSHALESLGKTGGGDGFLQIRIGGDRDSVAGGYYQWDADAGAYVNDNGHKIPPEDAPSADSSVTTFRGEST